jgi:hypothetical protein
LCGSKQDEICSPARNDPISRIRVRAAEKTPFETVRKGSRVASRASILLTCGGEIGLLRPGSRPFEAPVVGLPGLFGQFLSETR